MLANQLCIEKIGNPENGYLSYFEIDKEVPFQIKRIYYIYDVEPDIKRGMHAHKALNQVIWCPHGIIEIVLTDGNIKESFLLDNPNKLLLVGSGIWRDMYWRKAGSVLCVAASDFYNEDDYIRDYDEFIKHVKEGYWTNADQF